jgi:membrane protease YdiL (CAAX protease family)
MDVRGNGGDPRVALLFFVTSFAWSWSLWGAAVATGHSLAEGAGFMLYITGALGPLIGAALVTHGRDHAYRQAFLRRIWDPRSIMASSWLALMAVTTLPPVIGAALASIAGTAATVPNHSVEFVLGTVVMALAAGLVEEPGWRGAALDALQERTRPLWAALGIGALWSFWHLPLSFFEGTYFHGLGFGSVSFWLTHLMLVQLGVLYAWLANSSGRSILIAVLAHAGFNAVVGLLPLSTTGTVLTFLFLTAGTMAVVVVTKGDLAFTAAPPGRPPGP